MALSIVLLTAGFVILIKGADLFVNGSASVAKRLKVSNLAIGLTVVAFGTSSPELLVSLMASTKGYNDAVFGNIVGSNLFNVMFILGITGLIYPLVVQRSTVAYEVPISIVAIVVLYLLVNDVAVYGSELNALSRWDSFILLVFFSGFMAYVIKTMKPEPETEASGQIRVYSHPVAILYIVLGLAMLVGGGNLVVENAVSIAKHYGLSEKLIGLTILAAGTSLPELATSAVAAYKKNTDIAIGNVIGSNIFNIFFILGITGMVSPVAYNSVLNFDLFLLLGSTVALMIFMFTINQRKLDRWEAFLLLSGYFTYTVYLISTD